MDTRTGRTFRIRTITPARRPGGACVFLDERGLCTVHDIAPAGCAFFDSHMDAGEAQQRSLTMHRLIAASPEYAM